MNINLSPVPWMCLHTLAANLARKAVLAFGHQWHDAPTPIQEAINGQFALLGHLVADRLLVANAKVAGATGY